MSINKEILYQIITKQIQNPNILWLAKTIILHEPTQNFISKSEPILWAKIPNHKSLFFAPKGQGLPIGNLTSQFFANVYLNELDQYIKHQLKVKHYLRYVDDFILLGHSQEQLKKYQEKIKVFLEQKLKLQLNQQKELLQPINQGIDWLGYIIKPTHITIRKRIINNCKQRLYLFNEMLKNDAEEIPPKEIINNILSVINSYYGHFQHANSFKLRQHLYQNHFKRIADYLEPKDGNLICFRIKAKYLAKIKSKKTSIPLKYSTLHTSHHSYSSYYCC